MTQIYLVRHAQAEGNVFRRAHGSYDSMITEQGYAQIAALEKRFAPIHIDKVYSSPRTRTRETAAAICKPKHLPLHIMDELHEVDCGPWEDRTWGDIHYYDAEQMENFNYHFQNWHVEGAETPEGVRERVLKALDTIVRECPDQTVAVVSHGMASRILLGTLKGMSLQELSENFPHGDNTAVSLIEYENGAYRVVYANDISHLDENLSTFAHQSWWKGRGHEELGLRFRVLDVDGEDGAALYRACRAEAWLSSHGNMNHYDGTAFLAQAQRNQRAYPEAVLAACCGDAFAGLLQIDTQQDSAEGVLRVPFVYMTPDFRKQGGGCQLVGEMISRGRAMGRSRIRLRCARENEVAQNFYRRWGFSKVGEDREAPVELDLLERRIGH